MKKLIGAAVASISLALAAVGCKQDSQPHGAPLTDGLAAAMMSPLKNGSRIFGLALLDSLGSLFGRQPNYIPGHGKPGDLSIGATPDGQFRSAGGHCDVYEGGASFADVLRTEIDFLHRHVKTAAQRVS
jgi:hypothetical protein